MILLLTGGDPRARRRASRRLSHSLSDEDVCVTLVNAARDDVSELLLQPNTRVRVTNEECLLFVTGTGSESSGSSSCGDGIRLVEVDKVDRDVVNLVVLHDEATPSNSKDTDSDNVIRRRKQYLVTYQSSSSALPSAESSIDVADQQTHPHAPARAPELSELIETLANLRDRPKKTELLLKTINEEFWCPSRTTVKATLQVTLGIVDDHLHPSTFDPFISVLAGKLLLKALDAVGVSMTHALIMSRFVQSNGNSVIMLRCLERLLALAHVLAHPWSDELRKDMIEVGIGLLGTLIGGGGGELLHGDGGTNTETLLQNCLEMDSAVWMLCLGSGRMDLLRMLENSLLQVQKLSKNQRKRDSNTEW